MSCGRLLTPWGGTDILANNAGIQKTVSLAEADAATWEAVLGVNLTGAFHTMRLAMPKMAERGYGRVVNIASVHGLVASVNKAPYVASKFGLVGLSRVAALEYAGQGSRETGGITVNCICPGWTETAIIEPQVQARAALHGFEVADRNMNPGIYVPPAGLQQNHLAARIRTQPVCDNTAGRPCADDNEIRLQNRPSRSLDEKTSIQDVQIDLAFFDTKRLNN